MAIEKTNINDVIDKNYAEFDLGLLCEETYKSLKHIDMVVYTILNNQHGLSVRTTLNGSKKYVDKNGYIFIGIGQDKLCKLLRTTRPTLLASLKRLEEAELIEIVNVGNMKCNRIYVGKLKGTITLGEYMRNLGIEENEAIEETTPSIDVVNIKDINKKAVTAGTDTTNSNSKNNNSNNSIPQKQYNDTRKSKKNNFGNNYQNKPKNKNGIKCVNDTFKNYEADELEKKLLQSQKGKFEDKIEVPITKEKEDITENYWNIN